MLILRCCCFVSVMVPRAKIIRYGQARQPRDLPRCVSMSPGTSNILVEELKTSQATFLKAIKPIIKAEDHQSQRQGTGKRKDNQKVREGQTLVPNYITILHPSVVMTESSKTCSRHQVAQPADPSPPSNRRSLGCDENPKLGVCACPRRFFWGCLVVTDGHCQHCCRKKNERRK